MIPLQPRQLIASYWMLAVSLGVFLLSQWRVIAYFWRIWEKPDYYYSHGILVPFLAGIMIWMNRERLKSAKIRSSWAGVLLIFAAAVFTVTGTASGFEEVSSAGFMLAIYGLIVSAAGWRVAGILVLPILFLVMMIPVPEILLESATGRYQIVSTTVAAKILSLADGSLIRYGNLIVADTLPEPLVIGAPCSGLKLLITLLMCACFLAYILEGSRLKKSALLVISFPLSILVNSIRIVLIGIVGMRTYSADAMHSFHDYSGYISLGICAALMLGFARLIGMRYFRSLPGEESNPPLSPLSKGGGSVFSPLDKGGCKGGGAVSPSAPWAVAMVILLLVAGAGMLLADLYDLPKGHLSRDQMPREVGVWTGHDLPIDQNMGAGLTKADVLYRAYVSGNAQDRPIYVFIEAAYELGMLHDPHLCLPGHGMKVTEDGVVTLEPSAPGVEPIKASLIRIENADGAGLMLYWYSVDGRTLPRKNDINRLAYTSRLSDIGRLLISPRSLSQVRQDILSRQIIWHRFTTDVVDEETDLRNLKRFAEQWPGARGE